MDEPSLFDYPISHTNDPPTSREAAQRHTSSGKRAAHAEIVLALVKRKPGYTAVELWEAMAFDSQEELGEMQECRRRLTDLMQRGLVRQGEARVCLVRGTMMVVWYAVEGE